MDLGIEGKKKKEHKQLNKQTSILPFPQAQLS